MDTPHLLIVDDDTRLRELLRDYLREQGFRVSIAADARSARAKLRGLRFDAMILDVMMPGESGIDLAKSLRIHDDTPILMLSAMTQPEDRINGFRSGVDDYLCKPFEPQELVMRIQAILKRTGGPEDETPVTARFGDYLFDIAAKELRKDGRIVGLTEGESILLSVLARHAGAPVERALLCREMGLSEQGRAIDVQVARLRGKIEPNVKAPCYIRTVRGQGYLLNSQ